MPDGMSYLPAMSRLFGEVEQPTNTQAYGQQFGGNPEQLMQLLQSPAFQQQFQQAGINFNPAAVRQSPFFPNQFMQQHPRFGGMMSGGMANAAMTPEAPEVSGVGSGISRTFQGMMGGPEMMRQYQVRQMMAPMQALGMTMPYQEFQRKQQLMDLLTQMEKDRSQQGQQGLDIKRQQEIDRDRQQTERIGATRPYFDPTSASTYVYQQPQAQQPPQQGQVPMPQGGQQPTLNQGVPGQGAMPLQGLMSPGVPAQQGGWQKAETPLPRVAGVAEAKETKATKGQKGASAQKSRADAGLAGARTTDINKYGGPGQRAASKTAGNINLQYDKEYQKISRDVMAINQDPKKTPEQRKQAQDDATIKFQRLEQDRQRDLANLEASGVHANTPPPQAGGPQVQPNPQQGAGQQQPPPRPANVPSNYIFQNGPQGLGWYNPQPKQ